MEIMDGFTRWDDVRNKAYNCKTELDKRQGFFLEDMAEDAYKEFLSEKSKNPTIAGAAMQEVYSKHPIKNPDAFRQNIVRLNENREIKNLTECVNNKIEDMYPRTHAIREALIQNDRVLLDKTTPKLTGFKKFLLGLKVKF